ncbi:MAG: DNA-protecting protein DprA [Bacteroidetes bacterium]|nr:DNA-protecting protein DprA [Bacteroidota bacterium]
MEDILYKISLTLIPGIGSVLGKSLIAYCGGVRAVFLEKKNLLKKIPGIGEQTINALIHHAVFDRAEQEVEFIQKYKIEPLFYLDGAYPARLKQCNDGPLMLYFKGKTDINRQKIISLVGTRSATEYGRDMCRKLIEGLSEQDVLIVSGLAYGIDTWSHKAALDNHLDTVGVLGHSLDRIYPYANRALAERMVVHGGLISEFPSGTKPDRENFPKRNRIIAGLSDAVIVVEAGPKGGALITADIANSYNRDVFAVPGRVGDIHSEGCNSLIMTNRAALVQSAGDILNFLNWDVTKESKSRAQRQLFIEYTEAEKAIIKVLEEEGEMDIDSLLFKASLLPSKAAPALLKLEFEEIIKCMPGKVYRLA